MNNFLDVYFPHIVLICPSIPLLIEIKLPTSAGSQRKQGNYRKKQKNKKQIYLCFINYTKAFACVDYNKLWRALKEMRIPNHLTCFLRNLYTVQEATVRTLHGTTDWFKLENGVRQGCLLSPCLFNLYAEHIMRNAKLESK